MGRKKSVDRSKLLEVVATIVASGGVGALTLDGVAKVAGISKGGVQAVYGSKEQMVKALFEECQKAVDKRLMPVTESESAGADWVQAYLDIIAKVDAPTGVMVAGVLGAMAKTPAYREDIHKRYANRMADMQAAGEDDRKMRLVFLATHGAFFLRYFGFMNFLPEQWDEIFSDIRTLALNNDVTKPWSERTADEKAAGVPDANIDKAAPSEDVGETTAQKPKSRSRTRAKTAPKATTK